ncbi:MAG: AAA family ATPase [Promethearchaeota archaeon]|nr:MAG: AAA family ATPase [Candidatus Lokiarchaeota archaeon]
MKIIIISGTPGTGKTTVSKKIAAIIGAEVISLNEIVISKQFTLEYDKKRDTYIVDFESLHHYILKQIEKLKADMIKFLIIEGHFSDFIPDDLIDLAIILRSNPDILYKRLEKRGYKTEKIIENVQAEILGNCVNYMIQKKIKTPILEIDTSNRNIYDLAQIIIELINNGKNLEEYVIGKIDWLEDLSDNNRLKEFFD